MSLSAALLLAAAPAASCDPSPASSVELVRRFYTTALVEKRVREGFERDVSPDFVEHKPDVASADREGAILFLEGLIAELPEANWQIQRVTGDAGLVAIHARFIPETGAPAYTIADFFRVEKCRIVEHWDVVANPVDDSPNPLPRY